MTRILRMVAAIAFPFALALSACASASPAITADHATTRLKVIATFSFFPTLRDPNLAQDYSPLWDLNIGVWSKFAVAHGLNTAKTDANEILELAAKGLVTSPGGSPLASSGSIINCPALAFTDTPPTTP